MNEEIEIRPIKENDNAIISTIIKSTLEEFDSAIEGTAYTDKETDDMFSAFADDNSIYYVALLNNEIIAGCGINPLKERNLDICELQKMYMNPKARGKKNWKETYFKMFRFCKKNWF